MAKSKNDNLVPHQFKPGQSGNPGGRPPLPEEIKKARKLNQIRVSEVVIEFLNMPMRDVKQIMDDPNTPALESMVARIIFEAQKHGDQSRANFVIEHGVGKLRETIKHELPAPTVIKLIGPEAAAIILGNKQSDEENEDGNF